MKRIFVLAASAALAATTLFITSTSASAHDTGKVTLYGFVKGVKTDGAFPARVSFIDPVTNQTIARSKTTVDIQDGEYRANLDAPGLDKNATYKVSMEGLEAAKDFAVIDYVQLQSSTPGNQQTGHLNISGYVLASRIGLGVSPTLAKVQVNETGTAQGVRSITNSGTAVYGQATASSGLAAGGYFSTSSVGGRAMVGDAFSTTGSTVGGLFYNRSSAGVAVWGRHINTSGNSIGVFGQTASFDGTAIMAENTSTGDTAQLAGSNGSLYTSGVLPRHEYASGTARTMIPIAYGEVDTAFGIQQSGSGNWTFSAVSTGKCNIEITNYTGAMVVIATAYQSTGDDVATYATGGGGDFTLNNWNLTTGALSNSVVSFVVYKSSVDAPFRSKLPASVQKKYKGDLEAWMKADPKGFETYRRAKLAAEAEATRVKPLVIPYDEGEPAGQPMNHALPPRN